MAWIYHSDIERMITGISPTNPMTERSGKIMKKILMIGLILALSVLCVPVAASVTISPGQGPTTGGTTVRVSSPDLVPDALYWVYFDTTNVWVSYTTPYPGYLELTTPSHAAGPVTVTVKEAYSDTLGTTSFTYVVPGAAPTITDVSPTSGSTAGGTSVTITGTGFTSATGVTFGGTAATSFTVDSATQITAATPSHAIGAVNVVVTTPNGIATRTDAFTYILPTLIISPASGPTAGGTTVQITIPYADPGKGPYWVYFDPLTFVVTDTYPDSTHLELKTPPHTAGTVVVKVEEWSHTLVGTTSFTYTDTIPSPEFPSSVLPVTMIIGFLGTVLFIQRTREQ